MNIRFIALLCLCSLFLFGCGASKKQDNSDFFSGGYVEKDQVKSSDLPPSPKPVAKPAVVSQPAPAAPQTQSF